MPIPSDVLLLNVPVNWAAPYVVRREYRTEVLTSRSGNEQRRALRRTPRIALEYTIQPKGEAAAATRASFSAWQHKRFMVADPLRSVLSITGLEPGYTGVHVSAAADWLHVGRLVVVGKPGGAVEPRILTAVAGVVLAFDPPITSPWPVGTKISAAYYARPGDDVSTSWRTNTVGEWSQTFDVDPLTEPLFTLPAAPATYGGRELFSTRPNWAEPVGLNVVREIERVDYGSGPVVVSSPHAMAKSLLTCGYLAKTSAEAKLVEQFFDRMKGRRGHFYAPTRLDDLPLAEGFADGANQLMVKGFYVGGLLSGSPGHKHIAIQTISGPVYRPVSAMAVVGENSRITLGSALPSGLAAAQVLGISWLHLWRHASDILTMEWVTDSVARVQMTFQMLPDSEPD